MFVLPFFDGSFANYSFVPQIICCIKSFLGKIICKQIGYLLLLYFIYIRHHVDHMFLILV